MRVLVKLILVAVLLAYSSTAARAQGGATSSVSGTVVDSAGAVIPGASIEVTNTATGVALAAVSNESGVFSVPAVNPGEYRVSVTLSGFRTYVVSGLTVSPGAPASIRAVLDIGGVTETIEVTGGAATLINTQTPTVAATLMGDEINKMPMPSRNLVNAVAFLPGVNTTGIVRDSSFNGLPDSFVAINLDGVNNNENLNKSSEGLFATISPRQDAVEAVTVTTAAAGADVGGHGAVQINFVTRAGSNRFDGSAYEYHRDPSLNSNYWFNRNAGLPKNDVTLNQYGFRQGGPLIIPQVYDGRGKAFFFVNYEELRFPSDATRTRVVYNPLTQAGVMQYNITSGSTTTVRQVNMLALAAANGFSAALDPVVTRTLGSIRAATAGTGLVTQQTDPNLMNFTWQSAAVALDRQPVVRLDYNLSSNHRLTGTFNEQIVHPRSGPLEQRRRALSGRPQPPDLLGAPTDVLDRAALDDRPEPGQRAARRGPVVPVVFRPARDVRPADVPGYGGVFIDARRRHHGLDHDQRAVVPQRLELPVRRHPQLAAGNAQRQHGRRALLRQHHADQPADRAVDRLRCSGGGPGQRGLHDGELSRGIVRPARYRASDLRDPDRAGQLGRRAAGGEPGYRTVRST